MENANTDDAYVQMKTHFQKKEEEIKEAIKNGTFKGKTASFAAHLQRYRDERKGCGKYCKPWSQKFVDEILSNGTTYGYVILRQCRLMCYKTSVLPIARAITNHPSNLGGKVLATLGINISAWTDETNDVDPTVTVSPERESDGGKPFGGLKIGVIGVLPAGRHFEFIAELAAFLYSSWTNIHEETGLPPNTSKDFLYNKIDLLIFTEKKHFKKLLPGCEIVSDLRQIKSTKPQCLYLETTEIRHTYTYINTYSFLNCPLFRSLTHIYDYFLRTDLDVFLSPTLLTYRPTKSFITGKGAYCVDFTRKHLEEVANRLGYRHRGIHNIGSTWFGKAELLANLSTYAVSLTMKLFDTEFDPKAHPEIAAFMRFSVHGQWAEWWRPTSSMYAQEIVLNHFLDDLSAETIRGDLLDVESCRSSVISNHLHVHTWHTRCQFDKFEFLNQVSQGQLQNGMLVVKLKYAKRMPVNNMSVREYCTHIAQHALFHLAEWFAEYTESDGGKLFGGLKIGVIGVLPAGRHVEFIAELAAFLYSSWTNIHEETGLAPNRSKDLSYNKIDLLIFTEKKHFKKLLPGCEIVSDLRQIKSTKPQCLYLETTEIRHTYMYINTYSFLNCPLFRSLTHIYDYFLRTDLDVFLSPTLLTYRPTKSFITGKGAYCVDFTRKHLKEVANRLGYRHRGIHDIGSTWFGKAELLANLSTYAATLTMKLFDTEFDPKAHPEIAAFMRSSVHGQWAEWWRPTSSMYAQEIVLNHFLDDLSAETIRGDLLDVDSCRSSVISNHLHIHTWHARCPFDKFGFLNQVTQGQLQNGMLLMKLKYAKRMPVNNMSVREYCTHIAQHALFHLAEWFAEYTVAQ
ncbi:hypothetical protein TTRE_0000305501 [Trichuris trichiura]|uniref:DUF7164 domain-containing protein n=1 Tax=Trichuris trichiura TaxID=36087 RepID=A0A077Z7X1_TRITR|nr:hypothetical protein TTRE_0000305501 [Trichuris trichiura]